MNYILIIAGFFILIKSASYLVDGSINIAKKYKISNLAIGLTIVAIGTSAPEIFVNITSAIKGETNLALGNIVGSNISNILLILGISAIIYPLKAQNSTVFKEVPFCLLVSLALFFLIHDIGLGLNQSENILSLGDSLVLGLLFLIFIVYTYGIMKNVEEVQEEEVHKMSMLKSSVYLIGGIIGLALGAELIVRSAKEIALSFGISETIIGLTVVAIGTSLPELATSISASLKRQDSIAIGNIVGSNIINIVIGLALTGLIHPIIMNPEDMIHIYVELGITILLMVFLFFGNEKGKLSRGHGVVFIGLYILYMGFVAYSAIN